MLVVKGKQSARSLVSAREFDGYLEVGGKAFKEPVDASGGICCAAVLRHTAEKVAAPRIWAAWPAQS
jgi:hypothetical protein